MSGLRVTGLTKAFGSTTVLVSLDLEVTDGITAVLGPVGLRQDHAAAAGRRLPRPRRGHHRARRPRGRRRRSAGAARARRVGYVPQEGALFPHLDVAAQRRLRAARASQRRGGAGSREVLDLVELPPSVADALPARALGRPAAAGGAGPGAGARARPRAARRAVLLARRRAARGHRPRRRPGAAGERRHGRAGHPRPGRGALAGRPGRGDVGGPVPPGRAAGRRSTCARRRPRWPASSATRRCSPAPRPDGAATCALGRRPARAAPIGGRCCSRSAPSRCSVVAEARATAWPPTCSRSSYFGHDATLRARVRDGDTVVHRARPGRRRARPGHGRAASRSSATCSPSRARDGDDHPTSRAARPRHPLLGGRPERRRPWSTGDRDS